ncbi:hypothetical protein [Methanobrevibacter sp.]
MNDFELYWLIALLCIVIVFVFIVEVYVCIMMAGFLASWFGFTGLLWWVCALLMFVVINGLIGLGVKGL